MAPKKKTSTMIWVKKSQQPAKMATENKAASSMMLDSSLLPDCSKLQLSSSPSAKMAQPATKEHTLYVPDWSLLPEELLHIISENLEDCFDAIHARSVCRPWRSTIPFPSGFLRPSYSLPSFAKFPRKSKGFCTLEKIPVFLFRVRAPPVAASPSEFFLGGINRDKSENHRELSSPIQCSVKAKIAGSDPTMMNMLDCQILPMGYQYRMIGWDPQSLSTSYRGVAFLPLNKEGGGGFVVLLGYATYLLVLRSAEMRWMRLQKISRAECSDFVTFRGRFYVVFLNGDLSVIDPFSLEETPLIPSERLHSHNYLVPSGNDELFLVEKFNPFPEAVIIDVNRFICRVSRLDEETGKWVVVSDLGDRVLFIGELGNCSCSAKELPDGCGVSGNSILFTYGLGGDNTYKYGVPTGNAEDDLSFWRISTENCVTLLNKSPPVLALQVER